MKRILISILILSLCILTLSVCTPKKLKDLNENEIKSVSVTTLPEFYGYEYSFTGDDARAVVDYLSDLNLIPRLFGLGEGGLTWVISIEYENGTDTTVYLFDDEIRIDGGAWYLMKTEDAQFFEQLLENLNQKQ
ncbi:MAG: hypothetical protein IIX44_11315 [Clostridia bacterium]|nr:hypothetical protein [Clostridia bacterium]